MSVFFCCVHLKEHRVQESVADQVKSLRTNSFTLGAWQYCLGFISSPQFCH
jgi:hypothetical protein